MRKFWTDEEIEQLKEMSGKYPLNTVARKLGRTRASVQLKRSRLGIGGLLENTDLITKNMLAWILGVDNRTITRWNEIGLKCVQKEFYIMYRQQDIIRFMQEHPERWNAARIRDDTLFRSYPWFREKRKNDISHNHF